MCLSKPPVGNFTSKLTSEIQISNCEGANSSVRVEIISCLLAALSYLCLVKSFVHSANKTKQNIITTFNTDGGILEDFSDFKQQKSDFRGWLTCNLRLGTQKF